MDLVALINQAIIAKPKDAPRKYIGASNIGRPCSRSIWYEFHAFPKGEMTPELKTTFEVGKRLENMILDYIELAGFELERATHDNDYLFVQDAEISAFQGHMDGIITMYGTPVIVEIKTAKSSSFTRFKSKGLREWNEAYFAQIHAYMGMSNIDKAVLIALNKDSSELHSEWISFDELIYRDLRMKALAITAVDEPPERINRNATFYICNQCQFKKICHFSEEQ